MSASSADFVHATTCAIEATGFCTCGRSAAHLQECRPEEGWCAEGCPRYPEIAAALRSKSPVAGEPGGAPTSPGSTNKPIASVRWVDSSLQNGQVDKDDFPKPCVITPVGYVVREDDEHIVLARDDMGHDGDYRGLVAIPQRVVLAVRTNPSRGASPKDRYERCSRCRHLIPTRLKLVHHFWCARSFPGSLSRNV